MSTQLAKSEVDFESFLFQQKNVPFGKIDKLLGCEGFTVIDENKSENQVILGLDSELEGYFLLRKFDVVKARSGLFETVIE